MDIEHKGNNEVMINGNIKTIVDSLQINDAITQLVTKGNRNIHLKIEDSFSMTSSVIGFLMKLVHLEKVHLTISVRDSRLFDLLEELSLLQVFNVRLIGT